MSASWQISRRWLESILKCIMHEPGHAKNSLNTELISLIYQSFPTVSTLIQDHFANGLFESFSSISTYPAFPFRHFGACFGDMASLDSEAAFGDRAEKIGIEKWIVDKFRAKKFGTFGKLAFAFPYTPQSADDTPLRAFITTVVEEEPGPDQMSAIRRLFFEAHTMALTDVRHRAEATPDVTQAVRKLPTAERVARQKAQQARLGGLVFTPNTIPANNLVDQFVEMVESGLLTYVKPEHCCSRAQEIEAVKRDPTVSTDASGMLKVGTKQTDPSCEANTELKLRSAWQRRNLAMDLAGLATFDIVEGWIQYLFQQLLKEQPRGFSKISLQQILDCDKHLFVLAAHETMGKLSSGPEVDKPLDAVIEKLRESNEVLQYLIACDTQP